MGIGKWILGGVCAVGAVVAAPVVLPMAAAGVAAAAGAATTVGAAVASSAVGTAVAGGMAAVGTTVGAAAGAVGTVTGVATISSVATVAGTATGAAAVGTIATAGAIGAATTGYGAKKMFDAKEIVHNAEKKYKSKKSRLDEKEKKANEALSYLGKLKLQIWSDFNEFYKTIKKIKNCNIIEGNAREEGIVLSKEELDNLKAISFEAIELLNASVGSLGVGALTGIAVYGGTMAIGTASTGVAIAGLSGIAATNATLAALGGGSIAAGGLGMAGGTAILSGLVAVPALAVGGIFLAFKGNSSVEKALEVEKEAEYAVEKLGTSIMFVEDLKKTVDNVYKELFMLNKKFQEYLKKLKEIVVIKQNFALFTQEERKVTEKLVLAVKILKNITTTDLLIKKCDEQVINKNEIEKVLNY